MKGIATAAAATSLKRDFLFDNMALKIWMLSLFLLLDAYWRQKFSPKLSIFYESQAHCTKNSHKKRSFNNIKPTNGKRRTNSLNSSR